MPIWFTAIGIGCIGAVIGYFLFYSFKRHHPPSASTALPINQLVNLLAAAGTGGIIGGAYVLLEGVNYTGPYGVGLAVGVLINVLLTMRYEGSFRLGHQPTVTIKDKQKGMEKVG